MKLQTQNLIPSKRRQRGAEAIEFAFTFPVLIILIVGIFEFGRAFWILHSMEEALNATGRYAMYNPASTNAQLITYFGQNITVISPNAIALAFANSATGLISFTSITATYNFVPVTGLIPNLNFPLTSTTRVPRI